jgi:hypothetical protein
MNLRSAVILIAAGLMLTNSGAADAFEPAYEQPRR